MQINFSTPEQLEVAARVLKTIRNHGATPVCVQATAISDDTDGLYAGGVSFLLPRGRTISVCRRREDETYLYDVLSDGPTDGQPGEVSRRLFCATVKDMVDAFLDELAR